MTPKLLAVRVVVLLTAVLGVNYIAWRWLFSVHWAVWWIAVPLVIAETYSLIDSLLFGLTMWRLTIRPDPPPAPANATVDVLITTYDEDLELVMTTARAALAIKHPHRTWILDDGNRAELRAVAESEGIGWIARSADWDDRPRHAKAGNLNNALLSTDGEFLLILDADQIPKPEILDRTLGYFTDEDMALVQTPQYFTNVPDSDPLGSQAPLFYGPLQQGKDGWNAAFFCGSNAVIRREALMRLGISRYVLDVERSVRRALKTADAVIDKARTDLGDASPQLRAALDQVAIEVRHARSELRRGHPLGEVTYRFQRRVEAVSRDLVEADIAALRADLDVVAELTAAAEDDEALISEILDDQTVHRLARRDWSPLGAMETVQSLITAIDIDRHDQAQAVMPMATISVTEDMATCMRLHSMGWRTAYHDEILATGLAPEDLATMITQRLRWAQGTMQVMFRENPLVQKGLSVPQRLMYFATMWSYLSGFAAVVYVAAPMIYLLVGILPVQTLSGGFFARFIPFMIANQLLFFIVGRGKRTWRGQQYSLALFPVWIRSVTTAVRNVYFGQGLGFAVTPKNKQQSGGTPWHLVKPQLIVMGLLAASCVVGGIRLAVGQASVLGAVSNLVWAVFDLAIFGVLISAARCRGFEPGELAAGSEPALASAVTYQPSSAPRVQDGQT